MSTSSDGPDRGSISETDALAIAEWQAAQQRVLDLVGSLSDDELERSVPACPDWRVRDLFAHMVGLGHDVLDGDEPDDHNPGWTQAQVDQRADRPVAEVAAEWRADADGLVAWMGQHGTRPLGDAVIHEQDLRGAVDRPGARDTAALGLVRDSIAGRIGSALAEHGLVLALEVDDAGPTEPGRWTSGDGEPDLVLRASGFELLRAVTSRRTADQLRAMVVVGDLDAALDAFAGLGELPTQPLPE